MLIILLGPPGCGKTTIGQNLSMNLGYNWIDVDDHLLEPAWKCTVAQKLEALGPSEFLKEESRILLEAMNSFEDNTVISLSGSSTCSSEAMQALKVTSY